MYRRQFLRVGVATAAIGIAGPINAVPVRRTDTIVIFDSRFEEARRFAAAATEQHGLRAFGFAGDATDLWHGQLTVALTAGKFVIGLTAGGARFCMQLMAGPGVRCIHHVTHTGPVGAAQHVCWAGEQNIDAEALKCGSAWPEQAALMAIRQPLETEARPNAKRMSHGYPAHHLPSPDHLESWVLAPPTAARRDGNGLFADWNN